MATTERVRTTISVDPEVLEVFRQMAEAAGVSVSRCMGDWLADTVDSAQLVAQKMQEARRAPAKVMREMQAMLHGAHEEAGDVLNLIRAGVGLPAGGAGRPTGRPGGPAAPSSNTGRNSPKGRKGRP
jgi:hypothetical protein